MHILHDNTLTNDNREKFSYVAGQYGQIVKFYNVDELCADRIAEIKRLMPRIVTNTRFTIVSSYRLLIPQVLSSDIDKCIYLDVDIIVNRDINDLWKINLQGNIIAAVSERLCGTDTGILFLCTSGIIKHEEYFNSGVMLLNLTQLRNEEKNILLGVKWCGETPQCFCFEQDILNYCFSKRRLNLPLDFNVFTVHAYRRNEREIGKKIYHFAGKDCGMDINNPFNRLWMKYFIRTPWFDEEAMGRLYEGVQQLHVNLKSAMIQISAIMSGKTRAFFADPDSVDAIKEIFYVRDDEQIIPAEDNESLKKLIDAMNASRGKKVFFIMIPFPFQILVDAGFEPGKDFINGLEFLSEAHGVPLNSYELIKAL